VRKKQKKQKQNKKEKILVCCGEAKARELN
jgi:hypothetical protein